MRRRSSESHCCDHPVLLAGSLRKFRVYPGISAWILY